MDNKQLPTLGRLSMTFWVAVTPIIVLRFLIAAFLFNVGLDLTDEKKTLILVGLGVYFGIAGVVTTFRAIKNHSALREQLKEML
jgi:hypothetical protein